MSELAPDLLHRRWVHSHEEDGPDTLVFRPADYAFPPSRGRAGLDLRDDGTYAESLPGADDRPAEAEGTWRLAGRTLELEGRSGGRVLEVVSAEPDRLVVRRG